MSFELNVHTLNKLCKGNPANLPDLIVWKQSHFLSPVSKPDAKGRIHMAESTLASLKVDLPIRLVRRLSKIHTLFRFDEKQLSALWGSGDALHRENKDHQATLRTITGHRSTDGAPLSVIPKPVESDRGIINPIMLRRKNGEAANDNSK